jgi:Uma2 family endonuclease
VIKSSIAAAEAEDAITPPDISQFVTEDDTPVDNLLSEKNMRLLVESLYTSWPGPADGRPYVAMANVGLFYAVHAPPLVPDVLLSLGVRAPDDLNLKENRSYFTWLYGKPPDVVIEIVSNREGGELGDKLLDYARIGVGYYVVFDPFHCASDHTLQIFTRLANGYTSVNETWMPGVELGLMLWEGEYESVAGIWLRWRTAANELVLCGAEAKALSEQRAEAERQHADAEGQRADAERQRADAEGQRADAEHQRAQEAQARAEALAAKLRALGVDPDA